ncbi:PREDICTED: uncharacterized protein LOC108564922, partial [Nicrophorus vespilloides]|uniref:Uncharacterized protein LOC108564922 n=1 Tax=Nicrophorus vespilloides TaxID=110193 RepID=A0ABM1MYG2_NICVS
MGSRSPIALLQEFTMKNKIPMPVYTFRQVGLIHYCKIKCFDDTIECDSYSKKLAKTKAATEMLRLTPTERLLEPEINSVGKLKELIDKHKLDAPTYKFVGEVNGRFCMDCMWRQYTTNGIGTTKQSSKHAAASLMLPKVQSIIQDYLKNIVDDDNNTIENRKNIVDDDNNIVENQKNIAKLVLPTKTEIIEEISEEDKRSTEMEIMALEENFRNAGNQFEITVISEKAPCVICLVYKDENMKPLLETGNNVWEVFHTRSFWMTPEMNCSSLM